jgi:hypothetical protein|tara:strand:- start:18977 stop:19255 length:279 start_codon:yes stop_codon:yes gene_type:complete
MFKELEHDKTTTIIKRLDTLENKISLLSNRIIKQIDNEDFYDDKSYLTKKDFSKRTKVSVHIIDLEIQNGNIKTTKRGERFYISADQVENYQ